LKQSFTNYVIFLRKSVILIVENLGNGLVFTNDIFLVVIFVVGLVTSDRMSKTGVTKTIHHRWRCLKLALHTSGVECSVSFFYYRSV